MATLSIKENRHGQKYYFLRWSEGGRRHAKCLGPVSGPKRITPHDAKVAKDSKNAELGTGRKIFTGQTLFDTHITGYLKWHAVEYPSSHERIAGILRDALDATDDQGKPFFRGKPCGQIDAPLVEKWKAWRQTQHGRVRCKESPTGLRETSRLLSSETVGKELRQLKACINKGVEWGVFDKHACQHVAAPKSLTARVVRYYDHQQLALLFKLPLHGAHWQWIANAGLRRGEAMHVKHGQVKLARREIHIESEPTARTKSAKERIVPMSDDCVAAYKRIEIAARREFRHLNGRLPSRDELADIHVLPKMAAPSWSRAFERDRKRLGLPKVKGSSVHILRHCYGSHASMGGVEIRTLQTLLGHASIVTTQKYANLAQTHLHAESRKIRL